MFTTSAISFGHMPTDRIDDTQSLGVFAEFIFIRVFTALSSLALTTKEFFQTIL